VGVVARQRAPAREVPGHAAVRPDSAGDLERERMRTVAVARHEQPVAGPRGLERVREQHQRERRARVAELSEQRVLDLLILEAEFARGPAAAALVGCIERDAGEVLWIATTLREQRADRGDQVGRIALLDREAVLPRVREALALDPPNVLQLVGD